ncbi:MAG: hypothetical protein R3F19_00895 [Verrucomicrobiales bacterium]
MNHPSSEQRSGSPIGWDPAPATFAQFTSNNSQRAAANCACRISTSQAQLWHSIPD